MKYAVISDIHGNLPMLQAVLADAKAQGAEGYLLIGDYCISAPWASEVVRILRELPNAHIVRGNDEAHLDVAPGDDGQFEVSRWCMSRLSHDDKAWLDALPEQLTFSCEGTVLHLAHSSEAFVGTAVHDRFSTAKMPMRYPKGPVSRAELLEDFRSFWKTDAFRQHVRALPPGVYLFGHNHVQCFGTFEGRVLVNPGSCGLPLDCCGFFGAAYSLLTVEAGDISVEERRVPFDVEELIRQVKATEQYLSAPVWTEVIFSEWRTGREKVLFFLSFCEAYANRIGDPRRPFAKDTWEAAYTEWTASVADLHPELFA